jgi:hypothetical protein
VYAASLRTQVLDLPDTLSEEDQYARRPRACTMGYLRVPVLRTDPTTNLSEVVYRCAAERIEHFEVRNSGLLGIGLFVVPVGALPLPVSDTGYIGLYRA